MRQPDRDGLTALIVEDHEMVSSMFRHELTAIGFDVVGIGVTADEGFALFRHHQPDLTLCDVRLDRGSSGIELTARIVASYPDARVLMVSAEDSGHIIQEALGAGAVGYVSKKASTLELLQAIKDAMDGMTNVADRHTYRRLIQALQAAPAVDRVSLTPRELEVVALLAAGVTSTAALGARMSISANSVRSHVENVMRKIGAHSRAEILARAFQLGIVPPPTHQ